MKKLLVCQSLNFVSGGNGVREQNEYDLLWWIARCQRAMWSTVHHGGYMDSENKRSLPRSIGEV